jgi:hypothetical protein
MSVANSKTMLPSSAKSNMEFSLQLFAGSIGAAGWILGAAVELMGAPGLPQAPSSDVDVVLLCAGGVLLTGFVIWLLFLCGRRLSVFWIGELLLGASLVFGTMAIVWMDVRGVLPLATAGHGGSLFHGQPGNEIWEAIGRRLPPKLAYAVPLLLLGLMAAAWWPPLRRRLFAGRPFVQRGSSADAR